MTPINTNLEQIQELEKILINFNRDKTLSLPIKLRYKSTNLDLNLEKKPIAIIIGEIHPGAKIKTALGEINYSKTSQSISKLILELYRNQSLKIGDAIKEGVSKITLSEENLQVNFIPGDSEALLCKSALLSYLLCSLPGECLNIEFEQARILEVLNGLDIKTLEKAKIQIRELRKELFIDKEPLSNLVKKVETNLDLELLSFRHSSLSKGLETEIDNLKYLCKAKLKQLCYERDKFIAGQFIMNFNSGIHPILIGELHTANLIKILEDNHIPCIYLSCI